MSSSDIDVLGRPSFKKSKNGELRALFSVGDFLIDANSSQKEQLCESSKPVALMAALAPATYTLLVEG